MVIPLYAKRAGRYLLVGVSTFGVDFMILALITTYTLLPYPVAICGAFLVGVSLNYLLSRRYVFKGTARSVVRGYVYMLTVTGSAAFITTVMTVMLTESLALNLFVARACVASVVGCGNYMFSLYVNFKVAGQHTEADT